MEHGPPVLNLSDVVNDDTIDDESPPDNTSRSILDSLRDSFSDPSQQSPPPPQSSFSEILEREIATLLNQNASAASAALLSAAAQQRQQSSHGGTVLDPQQDHSTQSALSGLNVTGLAAVLQAAHAHSADAERNSTGSGGKSHHTTSTRTAPAFHSLTASSSSQLPLGNKRRRPPDEGPDTYLYSDGGRTDDDGDDDKPLPGDDDAPQRNQTSYRNHSPSGDESPPRLPGEEFSDINDILHQLSSEFDPERCAHDASSDLSPVVPHSRPPSAVVDTPTSNGSPVLSPSNRRASQTVSSTSSTNVKKRTKTKGQAGPHICDDCSKVFTRRSDLSRHIRIHTGERPFPCNYHGCGKSFIQRSALHVHQRVHTGEKPHSCEYPGCEKTFGDSSSLARHRRTHTGKRPYKCEDPSCEKTFTRRTTLTQHMRTHDPGWEPDPNIKYSFKASGNKRRRVHSEGADFEEEELEDEDEDDQELVESVRTISALFNAQATDLAVPLPAAIQPSDNDDEELEVRVASISAEIAAAIAQAQTRVYDNDDDEDDDEGDRDGDDEGDSSLGRARGVRSRENLSVSMNTSGIRRGIGSESAERNLPPPGSGRQSLPELSAEEEEEEEEEEETFPAPLRRRNSEERTVKKC